MWYGCIINKIGKEAYIMSTLSTAVKNIAKCKSKTVNYNALVTGLIPMAAALGYPIPESIVPAIYAIGNVLIRFFTTKALSDK